MTIVLQPFWKIGMALMIALGSTSCFADDAPAAAITPKAETGPYAQPATLNLSLQQAVEMALKNNVDIATQRIQPLIAAQTIQLQKGNAMDPIFDLTLQRQFSERANVVGSTLLPPNTTTQDQFNASLSGKLPIGAEYSLSANMNHFQSTQQSIPTTTDEYIGFAGLTLRQHFLKDFGPTGQLSQVWIAQKSKAKSDQDFALQVMRSVGDVQSAYYDLAFSKNRELVQEEALSLARTLWMDNKKRLEVGVISPLEVTQAEAGVAKAESDLLTAHWATLNQENVLKLLISRDVYSLRKTRLELSDGLTVIPIPLDLEQSIRHGLNNRPDYLGAKIVVQREKITVRYTHNQAFPEVDLFGSFGANSNTTTSSQAINDVLSGLHPSYSVGIEFKMPIPNRAARANYRGSRLNAEAALEQLKKAEQQVIVDVDNSIGNVDLNLKRVEATRTARRLAEESLKAEDTKYRNGVSSSFQVLQAQSQLTAARGDEIRAIADYNKSLSDLSRADGTILERNHISLQFNPHHQ